MYILVCPHCESKDIEEFEDRKNMYWCHYCGEEIHRSELEVRKDGGKKNYTKENEIKSI